MKAPVQFGPYQLLERISVGGMAEVYKAKEFGADGFERLVAIKRILPHVAEDEEFIAMFKDEAKIAVQLSHGNIAQIYNLDTHEDGFYIALEYVAGRDLRAIFQRCQQQGKPMPIEQACYIVMKVCEGLDYAHNKKDAYGRELNIVHRDVSPPNILVSYEGEVKLIDFGVAKAAGRASKTQAGILKGKFGYMSPEQVRGMPLDRRSDVFSVGVVLWEILTGQRLFQGDTDFATLEMVRKVEVPSPRSVNPAIPEDLERIVFKALARDPDQRYQSAIELHDELQAFMFAHGLFYSRKALAAWMRKQYAKEIELEKEKANRARGGSGSGTGRQRKTMMMTPGSRPPPPPPGGRPPPPPSGGAAPPSGGDRGGGRKPPKPRPSSVPTQAHQPVSAVPPPSGPPRPKPGGRGARRTMMMTPGRPAPLGGASPKPAAPKPAAKPARPKAAPAKAAGGGDFDWDDDELETRLFDGDVGQGLEEANRASEMQAARSARPIAPASPPPPSSRPTAPPGPAGPPTPAGPPGSGMAPAGPPSGAPPAAGPPAAAAGASLPRPPSTPAAAPTPSPVVDDEPARSRRGLWLGLGAAAVLLLVAGGVGVMMMNKGGDTPAAGAAAGFGSLTVNVKPADATVTVDGQPVAGTSPFLVPQLAAGSHKVVVSKPGYAPFEKEITVQPGAPLVLPVELGPAKVDLSFAVEPASAQVALVEGDKVTPIGTSGTAYALSPKPGVTYQIEVSAPGYVTKRIPLELDGSTSKKVEVTLDPEAKAAPEKAAPERTAARTPRPTKKRTSSSRPKARPSGSGLLGVATAPGTPPASVSIDGKGIGKTPRPPRKVSAGSHMVKCTWSDGKSYTKRVTVPKQGKIIVRCQKK
ncbi:MAG: PEGA domain-containing protein [Deltaproteobacteria bacterium]|nr:MAG: PEGA domain-containing protein [Deltaproteobacteria bacterium]